MITLDLLTEHHAAEVLEFERSNRTYFRTFVPDRGDSYFDLENLRTTLRSFAAEMAQGLLRMYLVRDAEGRLVGRVNLVDIAEGRASLGYRIGQAHTGKGYATQAVRLALAEAFGPLGLHRVDAVTTAANAASQAVLLRAGFALVRREPGALEHNGIMHDALHYSKTLPVA